ncbi:MAG: TAXI family TRAP transporter solute-binding subunit [Magnetococcales bacterium]|nr:TAXI family TRAP transporter solute-binding subunit [Magnetococcales bacterium]
MFTRLENPTLLLMLFVLSGCVPWGEDQDKKSATVVEKPVNRLTIALGQTDGANYAAGHAICVALKKSGSGLPCKILASNGSQENIAALNTGQVDLAFVRGDVAYQAWHGQGPFTKKSENIRVLFSIHHEMLTLLVNSAQQILSFKQIVGHTIHIGSEASSNGRLISDLLNGCQIPQSQFSRQDDADYAKLLTEGTVEGAFELLSHPDEQIETLSKEQPGQILPINGRCVEQLVDERFYLDPVTIADGLYSGQRSAIPTIGVKVWLMARGDLSESAIYEVTKTVFNEVEQFRRSDPAFYQLSPRKMVTSFAIPFHRGAARYYQEQGWYQESR